MNFNLHFSELHSDISINDKNNLFENYISKRYKCKIILISFNCFSEYMSCNAFRENKFLAKISEFTVVLIKIFRA